MHSTDRVGVGWVDGQAINNAGLQLKQLMTRVQRKAVQTASIKQNSRQQLVSPIYVTLKDFGFLLFQPCSWFQVVCDVPSCQCQSLGCFELNRCASEGDFKSQLGLRITVIAEKADAYLWWSPS